MTEYHFFIDNARLMPANYVPQPHGTVIAGHSQALAVRAESYVVDTAVGSQRRCEGGSRSGAPDTSTVVVAGSSDTATVWTEHSPMDDALVPHGFYQWFPVDDAPDHGCPIRATGQQTLPGRTESHMRDTMTMAQAWTDRSTVGDVPDLGNFTAAASQILAVGAESEAEHRAIMEKGHRRYLSSNRIPQVNETILACGRQPAAIGAEKGSSDG